MKTIEIDSLLETLAQDYTGDIAKQLEWVDRHTRFYQNAILNGVNKEANPYRVRMIVALNEVRLILVQKVCE